MKMMALKEGKRKNERVDGDYTSASNFTRYKLNGKTGRWYVFESTDAGYVYRKTVDVK